VPDAGQDFKGRLRQTRPGDLFVQLNRKQASFSAQAMLIGHGSLSSEAICSSSVEKTSLVTVHPMPSSVISSARPGADAISVPCHISHPASAQRG
jgi:hypothetical protein